MFLWGVGRDGSGRGVRDFLIVLIGDESTGSCHTILLSQYPRPEVSVRTALGEQRDQGATRARSSDPRPACCHSTPHRFHHRHPISMSLFPGERLGITVKT